MVSGIAGMNIQGAISKIMSTAREPLYNMAEEKGDLSQKKSVWRNINSRVDSLGSKLAPLREADTFQAMKTSTTDKEVAGATAEKEAVTGNYTLDVSQLAQVQRVSSAGFSSDDTDLTSVDSGTFKLNGESIEVAPDASLIDIKEAINKTEDTKVEASVISDTLVLEAEETGTTNAIKMSDSDGILRDLGVLNRGTNGGEFQSADKFSDPGADLGYSGSFKINGTEINVETTDSLNDIEDAIESNSSATGHVADDDSDGSSKLVINGADSFTDTNGILSKLGVVEGLQPAQDAKAEINGVSATSSSNQMTEAVSGVTFTLKETGTTTIEVSKDLEKATSAVQKFVDKYNSIQDFIGKRMNYNSETGEAGILQGNGTLMRISSSLRTSLTGRLETNNDYNSLYMVGISFTKQGTMEFDKGKFKEALASNPQEVKELFAASKEDDASFNGVATQLGNYLDMLVKSDGVIPNKVDSYEDMIQNIDEEMTSLQRNLKMKRQRLKDKFINMQQAVVKMQNQSQWLESQISSLGSGSMISSMM